jgi:protein SCO1/2
VFFGYTQCPTPARRRCRARAGQEDPGARRARLQVVFVTVDPERDTASLLKSYVGNFGSDVVALRGDASQVKAVAREFKVFYEKVPGTQPDNYTIDHTAGTYFFDPQGRVRLFARNGMEAQLLAADVKALLDQKA